MSESHWILLSHLLDYGSLAAMLVLSAVAAVALARTPTPPCESETEASVSSAHTHELRDAA